jgi:hypothetical protein
LHVIDLKNIKYQDNKNTGCHIAVLKKNIFLQFIFRKFTIFFYNIMWLWLNFKWTWMTGHSWVHPLEDPTNISYNLFFWKLKYTDVNIEWCSKSTWMTFTFNHQNKQNYPPFVQTCLKKYLIRFTKDIQAYLT